MKSLVITEKQDLTYLKRSHIRNSSGRRRMKIFEIYDEELDISIGTLMYYEKSKSFIIELLDNLDEWTAPLLFTAFVKKNIFTIPSEFSYLWVKERVIPSGRQNIKDILNTHNLKEYDEFKFLELANGRCSQDRLFIKKLNELPEYVKKRAEKNIVECIITGDNRLLCMFADDLIKKIDLNELKDLADIEKIQNNQALFETVKVGTGGYSIVFNDSIEISARDLYNKGVVIPLGIKDFIAFAKRNILDTSEVCDILDCSRQNISYLVKEDKIYSVKENVKGNLYLKGDVLKNKW